jgi:hypothetical protein
MIKRMRAVATDPPPRVSTTQRVVVAMLHAVMREVIHDSILNEEMGSTL